MAAKQVVAATQRKRGVTSGDTPIQKPTVVEAVASGLGITKKQVHARVQKAAKAAGAESVSIDDDDADGREFLNFLHFLWILACFWPVSRRSEM